MNVNQRIADTEYTSARIWSKSGKHKLETGLTEMRANNFPNAISSMKDALEHFSKVTESYERARELTPSGKLKKKFERKAEALQSSDVACAMKALSRMEPIAEKPMDLLRKRFGARKGDSIIRASDGGLI